MPDYLVSIPDLPTHGAEYTLDLAEDKAVWQGPLEEFGMDVRLTENLEMKIRLLPADGGCLLRGKITGAVVMPCLRCAEDTRVDIAQDFEDFIQYLPGNGEEKLFNTFADPDTDSTGESIVDEYYSDHMDTNRIAIRDGVVCVDLAIVAWEEFALALPFDPLCRKDCKGLCAGCGANLNEGQCDCRKDEGDPRMAVLRGLVLDRKGKDQA